MRNLGSWKVQQNLERVNFIVISVFVVDKYQQQLIDGKREFLLIEMMNSKNRKNCPKQKRQDNEVR